MSATITKLKGSGEGYRDGVRGTGEVRDHYLVVTGSAGDNPVSEIQDVDNTNAVPLGTVHDFDDRLAAQEYEIVEQQNETHWLVDVKFATAIFFPDGPQTEWIVQDVQSANLPFTMQADGSGKPIGSPRYSRKTPGELDGTNAQYVGPELYIKRSNGTLRIYPHVQRNIEGYPRKQPAATWVLEKSIARWDWGMFRWLLNYLQTVNSDQFWLGERGDAFRVGDARELLFDDFRITREAGSLAGSEDGYTYKVQFFVAHRPRWRELFPSGLDPAWPNGYRYYGGHTPIQRAHVYVESETGAESSVYYKDNKTTVIEDFEVHPVARFDTLFGLFG